MLSFTILTTEPADGIRDLHNRTPVMLAPDGFESWLSGTAPVVDAAIDAAVQVMAVSQKVNSPRYDEPDWTPPKTLLGAWAAR
jgi:putative SOS response-associated peptidase YedK